MIVLREMRRRAKVLVPPVLGLALTGYFAYHLVEGDRGLRAWMRLTQELRSAKMALADVSGERARLERRAGNMRSEHLDPDLLDSQVRRTLDFARTLQGRRNPDRFSERLCRRGLCFLARGFGRQHLTQRVHAASSSSSVSRAATSSSSTPTLERSAL